MATDLLPLPVQPDLPEVPTDPEEMREWLTDFRKRYNAMYAILRQDINRLSAPAPRAKAPVTDVEELGYVLAVLWGLTADPPPDQNAIDWAARPRMIPTKIRAFLKKFSFG